MARLCKSLEKLRAQINEAYPGRDKTSDGWIGDARHRSNVSDHNPWVVDDKGGRVVTALDTDEDLSPDINSVEHIIDAIRASRDPRVKYIIYEKRITVKGSNLQQWKRYTGKNPHDKHAHISVFPNQRLYDDETPWQIGVRLKPADKPVEKPTEPLPDRRYYIVQHGDTLWKIASTFNTNVATLKEWNAISNPDFIRSGTRLRVR